MQQSQSKLPGQEISVRIIRDTFKKDGNFVVVLEEDLKGLTLRPGDHFTMHTLGQPGTEKEWAGAGICTHFMTSFILEVPKFILEKSHDPLLKNPIALVHWLQTCAKRMILPSDVAVCIGFRLIQD